MATDGTESATVMAWVAKDADPMAGSDTSALKVAAPGQWNYVLKLPAFA
jgi:hypothetical protein